MLIALLIKLFDSLFVAFATAAPPVDIGFGGVGSTAGAMAAQSTAVVSQVPIAPTTDSHMTFLMAFFYYLHSLNVILPVDHMLYAATIMIFLSNAFFSKLILVFIVNVVRGAGSKI